MSKNNLAIAEAYYTAMGDKNIAGMEKHLHPDVECNGPLAKLTGKEDVLDALKKLLHNLNGLKIRAKLTNNDQVILVIDMDCPAPVGKFPSASFLSFKEGKIVRIELFFDARSFEKK